MLRVDVTKLDWIEDCLKWRGVVLVGKRAHWCYDWDGLPVDETTIEINTCHCWDAIDYEVVKEQVLAIPQGNEYGANRYDTDNEIVLHLWDRRTQLSYDIRLPK